MGWGLELIFLFQLNPFAVPFRKPKRCFHDKKSFFLTQYGGEVVAVSVKEILRRRLLLVDNVAKLAGVFGRGTTRQATESGTD